MYLNKTKDLNVLHVIPYLSLVRGGPSQGTIDTIRSLNHQGINALVVTTDDDGPSRLDVPLGKSIDFYGVSAVFFKKFSSSFIALQEFSFSVSLTSWLWKNISDYDVVHVHTIFSYPSTIAMIISRIKKVPYFVQPHGLLCRWALKQSHFRKKVYLKLIERNNINNSSGIILTTEQELCEVSDLKLKVSKNIIPYGVYPPDIIHNAREIIRGQLNIQPDEVIILFMARLHKKKGLDFLIPALSKMSNTKFKFLIAGSGNSEYEAEVSRLLKESNLESRTIALGFVSGEFKQQLLQAADLFVLTSHSENFGVSVFEAWSSGLPTLLTPGVALANLSEKNGFGFVAELSVESIAQTLNMYMNNPSRAKEMGNYARDFIVENYSWEKISRDFIAVYRQVQ